jgi:hypothetical protein
MSLLITTFKYLNVINFDILIVDKLYLFNLINSNANKIPFDCSVKCIIMIRILN